MKKIFLILVCLTVSLQSVAAEKSVMQSVLEEMGKKYVEESVKSQAIKKIEEYAAQQLGQNLSGSISSALAALSFLEGIQSYDKATSETQRYMAFAQASAAAVTLAAPPVGALVSLGTFVQGIGAALVSKRYSLAIAKLIQEISEIEKQTSEIILKEANAEKTEFEALVARSISLDVLLIENSKILSQQCMENSDISRVKQCLQSSFLQKQILSSQVYALGRIAKYNGRFIKAAAGLTPEKINEINEILKAVEEHLKNTGQFISALMQEMTQSLASEIRKNALLKVMSFKCHRLIGHELSLYLQIKLDSEEHPEDKNLQQFALNESQDNMQRLLREPCKGVLPNLDADLIRILKDYEFLQN